MTNKLDRHRVELQIAYKVMTPEHGPDAYTMKYTGIIRAFGQNKRYPDSGSCLTALRKTAEKYLDDAHQVLLIKWNGSVGDVITIKGNE